MLCWNILTKLPTFWRFFFLSFSPDIFFHFLPCPSVCLHHLRQDSRSQTESLTEEILFYIEKGKEDSTHFLPPPLGISFFFLFFLSIYLSFLLYRRERVRKWEMSMNGTP